MMKKIKTVEDLVVWQRSMDLVEKVYAITKKYPRDEQYGITSQMRRAAVSIPSNIAEGFRRQYAKEYKQFLYISLGSSSELKTLIEISVRLNYLNDTEGELKKNIDHISAMIVKLAKCL